MKEWFSKMAANRGAATFWLARFGPPIVLIMTLLVWAWSDGKFNPEYLRDLSPWVFWLGAAFAASVFGALRGLGRAYRLAWEKPDQPSRWQALREAGDAYGIRALYGVAAALVALICFDNRAIENLVKFPETLSKSAEDCPPPEEEEEKKKTAEVPPGCAFVMRAYERGFVKDLGTCAPTDEEEEEKLKCTGRQYDEPYFHYTWRLLMRRVDWVKEQLSPKTREQAVSQLKTNSEELNALTLNQRDALASRPRASHHLFTNLPAPKGILSRMGDSLSGHNCLARLNDIPHLLPHPDKGRGKSQVLDHAVRQVLFNPVHGQEVALCTEHVIHWNSPIDTCQRLVDAPEDVLDESGALPLVRGVLARRDRQRALRARGRIQAPEDAGAPEADANVVSFQCLMIDRNAPPNMVPIERNVTVDGQTIAARELRIPAAETTPRGQIELMRYVAAVFAPEYVYGRIDGSNVNQDDEESARIAQLLKEDGYLLSKLELLERTSLFDGHEWLDKREDLLEVYPYHLHITKFVKGFRSHYALKRRRL